MKAVACKSHGPPESLVAENIPSPTPGPGEAVVSVKAPSVNFPDVLIIQNKYRSYWRTRLPREPSMDRRTRSADAGPSLG